MVTYTIQDTINGLVKVAENLVDNVEKPQSVGPDEAYEALEGIISQLESLAQAIPAQGGSTPEQTPAKPNPQAIPNPQTAQITALESTVKTLKAALDSKERAEIAEETASYFNPVDQSKKFDEIMKSKDSIETLKAKLETIADYAEKSGNSTRSARSSSGFSSYVRVAKNSDDRLLTI